LLALDGDVALWLHVVGEERWGGGGLLLGLLLLRAQRAEESAEFRAESFAMLRGGEAFANELTDRPREIRVQFLDHLERGLELLDLLLKLLRGRVPLLLSGVL
jgi:hypothetical protein